jgi:hypothetical protein
VIGQLQRDCSFEMRIWQKDDDGLAPAILRCYGKREVWLLDFQCTSKSSAENERAIRGENRDTDPTPARDAWVKIEIKDWLTQTAIKASIFERPFATVGAFARAALKKIASVHKQKIFEIYEQLVE